MSAGAAGRAAGCSDYPAVALLVDGTWRPAAGGRTLPVIDPATERRIGDVPVAAASDVDDAIAAAHAAMATWSALAPAERARIICTAADLLRQRREATARVITRELGKPLAEARLEVDTAANLVQWNGEEGRRAYGRVVPAAAGRRQLVLREPVGPVAAFAPWNAPLITPARKVSQALAAGCTVVVKPAEETPGGAVCLAQAFCDAGLPPGALNVVFGEPAEVSRQLIGDPRIRAITFTGSTRVGRSLAALAAGALKPAVMELGGHAPVVVCADAPVAEVAAAASRAAYRNAGQVCTSPTRFLVAAGIYPGFVEAFGERVAALRVGDPFGEGTDVGPLGTERRLEALDGLVRDAVGRGARLLTGGRRVPDRVGYFWEPTLLADVGEDCLVSTVEPFGPLATVTPFGSLDEAVHRANATDVGLAGYVFTHDAVAQHELTTRLRCGAIALNEWAVSGPETPFGGHRDSGFGSEGGIEGIAAFQQTRYVGGRP